MLLSHKSTPKSLRMFDQHSYLPLNLSHLFKSNYRSLSGKIDHQSEWQWMKVFWTCSFERVSSRMGRNWRVPCLCSAIKIIDVGVFYDSHTYEV